MISRSIRPAVTGVRIAGLMAAYAAQAVTAKTVIKDDVRRRRYFVDNVSRYAKRGLKAMGFELEVIGYDPERFRQQNYLLICNHMSYMDILCLSSVHPCIFVTSVDMGETFFLGKLSELGGSLFVERRHRGQVDRDLTAMSEALRAGFDVVIYPEGTSTNGDTVIPFKKSLLMSAVEAGVDILPLSIKYTEINGEPFSEKNRDQICWYGDMSFAPHLGGIFKLDKIKVRLEFLEPIKVTSESTRDELAGQAHSAILNNYSK